MKTRKRLFVKGVSAQVATITKTKKSKMSKEILKTEMQVKHITKKQRKYNNACETRSVVYESL